MIIYISLWIINVFCILNNRNNRFISLLTYIFMGSLFVSNKGISGDAYIYKSDFEKQVFSSDLSEIGYTSFEKILCRIGVDSYNGLLVAIFIFCTIFLIIGLMKFNISLHPLIVMIMPFIFPTYSTAIRFFMASSIMVLAIRFLASRRYVWYILLVILATLFHRISLVYLLFILCTSDKMVFINANKKLCIRFITFISLLSVIITIFSGRMPLLNLLIRYASMFYSDIDNKIEAYMTSTAHYGASIFMIIYFSGLIFAYLVKKKICLDNDNDYGNENTTAVDILRMADINLNINLILSVMLPFIALNLVFYRLLIIGFISDAIVFGMYMKKRNPTRTRMTIKIETITVSFVITSLLWLIPEIVEVNSITIKGLLDASFLNFF